MGWKSKFKKYFYDKSIQQTLERIFPFIGYKKSDVIISSFPKSGRNWLLFLLANCIKQEQGINIHINFHNIHQIIPRHLTAKPTIKNYPRIIASHKKYIKQKGKFIYLIRNPADTLVSYYHFQRHRFKMEVGPFSDFLRSSSGLYAWKKHVKSWENKCFCTVKYEDMKKDTYREIKKVLEIFDKYFSDRVIKKSIYNSSFNKMKEIEKKCGLPYNKQANVNYTFVREGKINKGKKYFTKRDYKFLRYNAKTILEKFNYKI